MTDTPERVVHRRPNRIKSGPKGLFARKCLEYLGPDADPKVWHKELRYVRGYPDTAEKFAARRAHAKRLAAADTNLIRGVGYQGHTRKGIPDGWAGRRPEVLAIRQRAAAEAPRIVQLMYEKGIFGDEELDPAAREALEVVVGIWRAQDPETKQHAHTVRDRFAAASKVLEYTRSKPVSKTELKVETAEAMLDALMAEETTNKD